MSLVLILTKMCWTSFWANFFEKSSVWPPWKQKSLILRSAHKMRSVLGSGRRVSRQVPLERADNAGCPQQGTPSKDRIVQKGPFTQQKKIHKKLFKVCPGLGIEPRDSKFDVR
jgi:hypothetical protein